MRARDVNRRIESLGGVLARTVGSHRRYQATYQTADGTTATCSTTVAQHPGDIPAGTLRAIERQMAPAFGKGWLR